MSIATNYPEIKLWGNNEYAIYDAIPALMQLLKDLGYVVDNRVDRMNSRPRHQRRRDCQKFAFVSKQNHGFYCVVKDHDQVQLDFIDRTYRIKSNKNWIDLKNPVSIELVRRRVRKLAIYNGF
jgi:hypothetical protein